MWQAGYAKDSSSIARAVVGILGIMIGLLNALIAALICIVVVSQFLDPDSVDLMGDRRPIETSTEEERP